MTPRQLKSAKVPFKVRDKDTYNPKQFSTVIGFSQNDPLGVGGGIFPDCPVVYFEEGGWLLISDLLRNCVLVEDNYKPEKAKLKDFLKEYKEYERQIVSLETNRKKYLKRIEEKISKIKTAQGKHWKKAKQAFYKIIEKDFSYLRNMSHDPNLYTTPRNSKYSIRGLSEDVKFNCNKSPVGFHVYLGLTQSENGNRCAYCNKGNNSS